MTTKLLKKRKTKKNFLLFFVSLPILLALLDFNNLLDSFTVPRFIAWNIWNIFGLVYLFKKKTLIIVTKKNIVLFLLLFSYTIISLISYFQAINKGEFYFSFIKVFTFILSIGILSKIFKDKKDARVYFFKSASITLVISIIWGFNNLYNYEFSTLEDLYQVSGNMGHKNQYSALLGLLSCFSIILINSSSKLWRIISITSTSFSLFFIMLLQTRSIIIAISIAFISILIVNLIQRNKRIYKKEVLTKVSILITVPILLISLFIWNNAWYKNEMFNSLENVTNTQNVNYANRSIKERVMLWEKTLEMISEKPVLGIGLGNWKIIFPKYGLENMRAYTGYVNFQRPHNDFLWVTSETGIIGGLIYLMIFGFILLYAIRILLTSSNKLEAAGLLAFFIIFVIFSLFSFPKERAFLLYLLSASIALTFSYRKGSIIRTFGSKGIIGTAIFLVILSLIGLKQRYNGDYFSKLIFIDDLSNNRQNIHHYARQAKGDIYTINTVGIPVDFYRGKKDFLEENYPSALIHYKNAYSFAPFQIHVINDLASSYNMSGNNIEAEKLYKKAISISPEFDESILNYAITLYQQKRIGEAFEVVLTCPKHTANSNYKNIITTIAIEKIKLLIQEETNPKTKHKLNTYLKDREKLYKKLKIYDYSKKSFLDFLMI